MAIALLFFKCPHTRMSDTMVRFQHHDKHEHNEKRVKFTPYPRSKVAHCAQTSTAARMYGARRALEPDRRGRPRTTLNARRKHILAPCSLPSVSRSLLRPLAWQRASQNINATERYGPKRKSLTTQASYRMTTQDTAPPIPFLSHGRYCDTLQWQENAGFKLLMKLGYKGGGLGKNGAGTANPLMPEVKQGRAG